MSEQFLTAPGYADGVASAVQRPLETSGTAAPVASLRPLGEVGFDEAWDDLVRHAAEPNVFAEPWFLAAARVLPQAAGTMLVEVREGARLIGALPLAHDTPYGRLPLVHVTTWQHFHSFSGVPLLRAGHETAAWTAILDLLDASDWARGLIHLTGLVEHGPAHRALVAAAAASGRPCATVHRIERALLASDLGSAAYYEAATRKKKRKEWKRLEARLADLGTVAIRCLAPDADPAPWADAYLALEARGWKGKSGSALAADPATAAFFHAALAGAQVAGRLNMRRLNLDGRPVAMLVNFVSRPGGFAFKTAFDEDFARFSPGVLLQIAAFDLLDRSDIAWVDSCAVADHAMIEQLWDQRRAIVRVTLPLAGARGAATFALARAAEATSATLRAIGGRS